jgi:hypothetical protein
MFQRIPKMWRPFKDALAITMSITFFLNSNIDFYKHYIFPFHNWLWLIVITIPLVYALYRTRPKLSSMRILNNDCQIVVKLGDIFDQPDALCFASNNYFETDTNLEPRNSLKSLLLEKYFSGNDAKAKRQTARTAIDSSLQGIISTPNPDKQYGLKNEYPIGTIAKLKVQAGARNIYLLALSRLRLDQVVHNADSETPHYPSKTEPEDLEQALCNLWKQLDNQMIQSISMPIIGSGLARSGHDQFLLLQSIIISFVLRSSNPSVKKLNIVVPKERVPANFMLQVEGFLKSIQADKQA